MCKRSFLNLINPISVFQLELVGLTGARARIQEFFRGGSRNGEKLVNLDIKISQG